MESTLLLDRNYIAVSVVGWKKAFRLLIRDKAEPVGTATVKSIWSSSKRFDVPSVLRLKNPISFNCFSGRIKFSRTNLMLRDQHKCQYCKAVVPKNSGTIDHILPRSRGGKTDYLNCVACCAACNGHKGDRTPEEAGMKLIRAPKRPNFVALHCVDNLPLEWKDFIVGV